MPVSKCENGKWRIGAGACIYPTREKAIEVWTAILASGKYQNKLQNQIKPKQDERNNQIQPEQSS